MMIDLLLPIILVGLVFVFIFYKIGKRNGLNQQIKQTQLSNDKILEERKVLQEEIKKEQRRVQEIESEYQSKKQLISDAKAAAEREYAERRDNLNNQHNTRYKELQNIFQEKQIQLQAEYDTKKLELDEQMESLRAELDTLQRQKAAIIEAKKREELIQQDISKYSIQLNEQELHDIKILNNLRATMFYPQVIGKIIWTSFIQKKLKQLCNDIVGTNIVTGIYKITNQITQEAYIGQSKNIANRFLDHGKSGVGAVEVSLTNKLYSAMLKDGIQNFSFEILEQCSESELNKKEKYYIELYNSEKFGYNSTQGNK